MSFLPISIIAYALNAGSIIIDKILLTKSLPSPFVYAFYINIMGLLVIALIPFGVIFSFSIIIMSTLSGVTFVIALLFLFQSLKFGEASVVAPVVGSLNPTFTLLIGWLFFGDVLNNIQLSAFLVLIIGTLILTSELWLTKLKLNTQLLTMVLSGLFFAISYIFLKDIFTTSNFVTGLVLTRLTGGFFVLLFLLIPNIRKQIFHSDLSQNNFANHTTFLLISGQSMSAVSGLMLSFAISLQKPALVNSLFGVQYIVILLVAIVMYKKHRLILGETLTKSVIIRKLIGVIIISFGLYLLAK